MPQHPAFFAIGGMAAGILSSCIGMPAMPGIASCFSMPPAGIDPLAEGADWVDGWPVVCPWAEAMAGDSTIAPPRASARSEEHTSELQSLMRISYAVFCLKKKTTQTQPYVTYNQHTLYRLT